MSWFRLDDGWLTHPKVRMAGRDGRSLWVATGDMCAAQGTDGVVEKPTLVLAAELAEVEKAKRLAKILTAATLWHDHSTIGGCTRCTDWLADVKRPLAPGEFLFHDWQDYQIPSKAREDELESWRAARKRALAKNHALRGLVRHRDRDRCRYCGVETRWDGDHRSPVAGTYDHIDPYYRGQFPPFDRGEDPKGHGNTLSNLCVACKTCNGRKRDRTPEQAGMHLIPLLVPDLGPDPNDLGRTQIRSSSEPVGPRSELENQVLARETGRVGSDLDRTQVRDQVGSTNGNGHGPKEER